MLFTDSWFLFAFLPITLLAVAAIVSVGGRNAAIWALIGSSLFFYGMWEVSGLTVIIGSIAANYLVTNWMRRMHSERSRRNVYHAGVVGNLLLLGYFKYTNFFLDNLAALGFAHETLPIVLPLGLSFYTFQQIIFLADCYHGRIKILNLREYAASVLFFPHLIAGPMVHYHNLMMQFRERFGFRRESIADGLSIFTIGLAKKLLIADPLSVHVGLLYGAAAEGPLSTGDAWHAALAYTMQLYFDFSGYSDMAIGLGLMFGIMLPLNFLSPYKAASIIEFWKRWHITLSEFLRDHLYFPLGGGRVSSLRKYINLMIVMLLGGLWHGAGWTFVLWGAMHGFYLCVNHAWRRLGIVPRFAAWRILSWALTFLCVVLAWVFFRADSIDTALAILQSMFTTVSVADISLQNSGFLYWAAGFALLTPCTAEWFGLTQRQGRGFAFMQRIAPERLEILRAVVVGLLIWLCLYPLVGSAPTQFLYFRF